MGKLPSPPTFLILVSARLVQTHIHQPAYIFACPRSQPQVVPGSTTVAVMLVLPVF
eukprot:XP_001693939.1 predicted protein [Chlamydomonas reinhardtii]